MHDVACAVTRDLNRHEYETAIYEKKCERFDDDIYALVEDEIKEAAAALELLADAITYYRMERGLDSYTENEYEERIQEALMKVEG